MMQRDAVADLEIFYSRTDFYNCAGGFMAEDSRRRHGAISDFLEVGRADAAHSDLDEQFVRADARDGDGFEAQIVDAAINDGAHGFRDGGHEKLLHGFHGLTRIFFSNSCQSGQSASKNSLNHDSGSQENSTDLRRQRTFIARACSAWFSRINFARCVFVKRFSTRARYKSSSPP